MALTVRTELKQQQTRVTPFGGGGPRGVFRPLAPLGAPRGRGADSRRGGAPLPAVFAIFRRTVRARAEDNAPEPPRPNTLTARPDDARTRCAQITTDLDGGGRCCWRRLFSIEFFMWN